jgi:uncharacterized protein YdcH (DUF465 family)
MSKRSSTDAVVHAAADRLSELRQEHHRLELRLAELERHLSLTPDEQIERANLKKAKLLLKDDIAHLERRTLH